MSRYLSIKNRKKIAERAKFCCEYCLSFEGHSFLKFQIEHIISMKHGGLTELSNLAYACFYCNSYKGTDLGTILKDNQIFRFYNPRKDEWLQHFELDNHLILPKTEIAEATIKILQLNEERRLTERLAFIEAGYFPHPNALVLINKLD